MLSIILATLCMTIGLIGIILPGLPGVGLVYLGVLIYGFGENPSEFSIPLLIGFGILTLLSFGIEWFGQILTLRFGKLSRQGMIGGVTGILLGLIAAPLGVWSLLALPPLGVIVGELASGRSKKSAIRAGSWAIIGVLVPIIINLCIGLMMVGWFIHALLV